MARHPKHRNLAEDLATALISTCDRYLEGYISRSTWARHARALWRRAEAAGPDCVAAIKSMVGEFEWGPRS